MILSDVNFIWILGIHEENFHFRHYNIEVVLHPKIRNHRLSISKYRKRCLPEVITKKWPYICILTCVSPSLEKKKSCTGFFRWYFKKKELKVEMWITELMIRKINFCKVNKFGELHCCNNSKLQCEFYLKLSKNPP